MNLEIKKLQKHKDKRGLLIEVLRDDEIREKMKHIYFSVSQPGIIRGNHFHKRKTEWFCVVKGIAKMVLENNESMERTELVLRGESPVTVKISPDLTHALANIGTDEMCFIGIVDEVFFPEDPDTFFKKILS